MKIKGREAKGSETLSISLLSLFSLYHIRTKSAHIRLIEAQEFGEMMEHVDEVNFALDGLRKPQPIRIRRASLLSLLSICATV